MISGYNEVIILKRLAGVAREKAASMLGISLYKRPNVSKEEEEENKFHWPSKETIEELKNLG